ncbi:hypothetical protein [Dendrosporobacter sp. 1207_IL3150]|uniref:hypothetical protein n=1 Tax=Dendrosporobacter sp. 1207_IL3150 TaxID=3084054 RepID=UPI002FDAB5E4
MSPNNISLGMLKEITFRFAGRCGVRLVKEQSHDANKISLFFGMMIGVIPLH